MEEISLLIPEDQFDRILDGFCTSVSMDQAGKPVPGMVVPKSRDEKKILLKQALIESVLSAAARGEAIIASRNAQKRAKEELKII